MNVTKKIVVAVFIITTLIFCGCGEEISRIALEETVITLESIPEYKGNVYVVLENNKPLFSEEGFAEKSFEQYSELDYLGRCGTAYANIGIDLVPKKNRGSIREVKPTGWHTIKYDIVEKKYLYNRCHLIGYQLTAENANKKNLITGTRYLNLEGMLPFENRVAEYIKKTKNHVLYRIAPVYDGENLVASGVVMEGYSVEDKGVGICFYVYVYNVQPGITIDYANGNSRLSEDGEILCLGNKDEVVIRGNSNSMIYHCKGQYAYGKMADSKYLVLFHSEEEAEPLGYRKAKR